MLPTLELIGGPLDGLEAPLSPFFTKKEWLVVHAFPKPPIWRMRQGWGHDEKPKRIAEGRYLYQLYSKSDKKWPIHLYRAVVLLKNNSKEVILDIFRHSV